MKFAKMNGAGNDFVILNNMDGSIDPLDYAALAQRLCRLHFGIGADGLMIVEPPKGEGDCRMVFYNNDGSTAEMCGNGARCICRYCHDTGISGETQRIETVAGLVIGRRVDEDRYRIRLNDPTAPVALAGADYLELGDPGIPHAVLECDLTADRDTLRERAKALRHAPEYPRGANVNLCAVTGEDTVQLMTFERGVEDFTLACGTGTGATVYALTQRGRVSGRNVRVLTEGGELSVEVLPEGLFLTGPADWVFTGELHG